MEVGTDTMTASKNMRSPKTSSVFSKAIVLFLGQWAIVSIALVVSSLYK